MTGGASRTGTSRTLSESDLVNRIRTRPGCLPFDLGDPHLALPEFCLRHHDEQVFADLLLLDKTGQIVLVEAKQGDGRTHRQGLAQLLEYGAYLSHYLAVPFLEQVGASLESKGCPSAGFPAWFESPEERLSFVERVEANLRSRNFWLVFATDDPHADTQAVFEFAAEGTGTGLAILRVPEADAEKVSAWTIQEPRQASPRDEDSLSRLESHIVENLGARVAPYGNPRTARKFAKAARWAKREGLPVRITRTGIGIGSPCQLMYRTSGSFQYWLPQQLDEASFPSSSDTVSRLRPVGAGNRDFGGSQFVLGGPKLKEGNFRELAAWASGIEVQDEQRLAWSREVGYEWPQCELSRDYWITHPESD